MVFGSDPPPPLWAAAPPPPRFFWGNKLSHFLFLSDEILMVERYYPNEELVASVFCYVIILFYEFLKIPCPNLGKKFPKKKKKKDFGKPILPIIEKIFLYRLVFVSLKSNNIWRSSFVLKDEKCSFEIQPFKDFLWYFFVYLSATCLFLYTLSFF